MREKQDKLRVRKIHKTTVRAPCRLETRLSFKLRGGRFSTVSACRS